MFGYNAVMYRDEQLNEWNAQLIPIQQGKKTFVTVREAAIRWGCGVATAYARLQADIRRNKAEKVGSHYHIFEEGE